jgi:hypothetical protein
MECRCAVVGAGATYLQPLSGRDPSGSHMIAHWFVLASTSSSGAQSSSVGSGTPPESYTL